MHFLAATLTVVALALNVPTATAGLSPFATGPNPTIGLVAATSGPCAGAFQVVGTSMCTHGADPAPNAILGRGGPSPVSAMAGAQAASTITCDGDGESGKRVQGLYVYVIGRQDRRSTYLSSFRTWAARADAMVQSSAAASGGHRHVRWVTNRDCLLAVPSVAVSPQAEVNFAAMISELASLGYDRNDRKYLVWFDSDPRNSSICGIGTVYVDDRPSLNLNDSQTGYARADFTCWNWSEPHELMHTLGAVQPSAPHATAGLHCTDEYDQMCYPDGTTAVMSFVCPESNEQRFDCGHDDYFSTSPAADNYLATHWNTADSGWLVSDAADITPPITNEPRASFLTGAKLDTNARVRISWPAASDESGIAAYELQRRKGSGSWTQVALASDRDTSVELDLDVGATYTFRVRARDGAGNTGPWATTSPQALTLQQETASSLSYTSGFKRVALSGASGGYVRKTGAAGNVATFTFGGSDVAFVSTLGPNRGTAIARLDGGTWQSLDLYNGTTQAAHVAWTASAASGSHTAEVRVSGVGNPSSTGARIDVDAFLFWKPAN